MRTLTFNRSDIISFFDLESYQQDAVLFSYYNNADMAAEDSYVIFGTNHEPLPLSMFIRYNGPIWDGIYGTSYFSAYFIKLSVDGSQAVICERYW